MTSLHHRSISPNLLGIQRSPIRSLTPTPVKINQQYDNPIKKRRTSVRSMKELIPTTPVRSLTPTITINHLTHNLSINRHSYSQSIQNLTPRDYTPIQSLNATPIKVIQHKEKHSQNPCSQRESFKKLSSLDHIPFQSLNTVPHYKECYDSSLYVDLPDEFDTRTIDQTRSPSLCSSTTFVQSTSDTQANLQNIPKITFDESTVPYISPLTPPVPSNTPTSLEGLL